MLNVNQVLDRLKITTASRILAVQEVRFLVEASENPVGAARSIIQNFVADINDFKSDDPIEARMTAQFLVDKAILLGEKYDPQEQLKKCAERIAQQRVENPWFFYRPQYSTVETTAHKREGVTVEMKQDGSFKKGSKQVLALALYEKHKALSNKEIIQIFMKELDMSQAGATTYLYNAKKASKV